MAPARDEGTNWVAGPVSESSGLFWDDRRSSVVGPHRLALPQRPDSRKLAFTLEHVLGKDECEKLIRAAEKLGFKQAGLGRSGEQVVDTTFRDSGRLITEDHALALVIFRRVQPHLPTIWQGRRLVGLNEQLKFLRYHPGQKFVAHYDGSFERPNTGNRTCLTLQLYLSSGHVEGGATIFCGPAGSSGVRCEPISGRALVFQHNILHEGEEVRDGVKYTIRTDVEYGPRTSSAVVQEALGFGGPWLEQRRRWIIMLFALAPLLSMLISRPGA